MRRFSLIIPSWYPDADQPMAGIFIKEQVLALRDYADVAVLHVREAPFPVGPRISVEDGVPVVRAQIAKGGKGHGRAARVSAMASGVSRKLFRYPKVGLEAFELLRETQGAPDIIHVQALWPAGIIAQAISRRHKIPYVVTEHSEEYLAGTNRKLTKYPLFVRHVLVPLAAGAVSTIAVSRFLGERLVELGLAKDPVVVPNAVRPVKAYPQVMRKPHVITHVSVMGPAKNIAGLLQACARLSTKRADFRLRLVGDGELRDELEAMSRSLGLAGIVEFTGRKSLEEVYDLLADSAFAVVSSFYETFSMAAAEALMCGRPVLSTRCGGPSEFITAETGLLVESDDVQALTEGLDWMLDNYTRFDPLRLNEYARKRFSPDVVGRQIVDVYEEALDMMTRAKDVS